MKIRSKVGVRLKQMSVLAITTLLLVGQTYAQDQDRNDWPTVRSGLLTQYFGAPPIIARDAGLFDKHEVNVEYVTFARGGDARDAILGGDIDTSIVGFSPFIVTADRVDIVSLGTGVYYGAGQSLVVGQDIESVEDLRGQRIGAYVGSGTHHLLVNTILPDYGLTPGDYELVDIELPDLVSALSVGQIAAFAASDPIPVLAEVNEVGSILFDFSEYDPTPGFFIAQRSWVEENDEGVRRYMRAIHEANELYYSDPELVSQILADFFEEVGQPLEEEVANQLVTHIEPSLYFMPGIEDYLTDLAEELVEDGVVSAVPDWSTILLTDFIEETGEEVGAVNRH